jgi:hypothetical protein
MMIIQVVVMPPQHFLWQKQTKNCYNFKVFYQTVCLFDLLKSSDIIIWIGPLLILCIVKDFASLLGRMLHCGKW